MKKTLTLRSMLPREQIKLDVSVETWQDAIKEAGGLLLNADAILPEYIDAMIQTAEELGPYIVISKGIALPHAAPEAGAKRTALALVRLSPPVNFGNSENDPVHLVFGLSAVDNKLHIKAMQSLAEMIMDEERISRIISAPNIDVLYQEIPF